jgi:hypothetical protein
VEVKQIFFEEYWESIPSDLPPALVIKNISFDLRFLISNWLAFNPNVAQKLGLEPVKDKGIFCWKYSNDIVIRSIYWMDGHPHFLPRDRDDECPLGIGWVVIIKESFLKHISDTIGKPMQFCFFSRCIDHHGENPNSKLQSWTKEYE